MLYKMTEWESPSGLWHCSCVDKLAEMGGGWTHPARLLKMPLDEYVEMVINEYNAKVSYTKNYSVLYFVWESRADARRYKNFINRKAREVNYHI